MAHKRVNQYTTWLTPEAVEEIKKKEGWVMVSIAIDETGKDAMYVDGVKVSETI